MSVILREKCYHLRKRVPQRFQSVEPREIIWVSLKTDSRTQAERKAISVWSKLEETWEARLSGDTSDAEELHEAAVKIARLKGFRYLEMDSVEKLTVDKLLERVEAISVIDGAPNLIEGNALLGGVQAPIITISKALEIYWDVTRDRVLNKNDDQKRRWVNPRKKAINNFIEVVGDKPLSEVSPDDMLDFQEMWLDRIADEQLTPNSANKDFTHLGDVLKTVNRKKRLGYDLPLAGYHLKEGKKKTRPPFSEQWIKEKLLAPGALDGLNTEARCLLLGMINTGYRPSEGANLDREHIFIEGPVPYIKIAPVGRELKTSASERCIPLVGVSLEAFRECPTGFPSYRSRAGVSDTINKFLKENALRETDSHSMYSLRHSFEDRMIGAGVDDRIRRDLFGHTLDRERYGHGATLEHKLKILQNLGIF